MQDLLSFELEVQNMAEQKYYLFEKTNTAVITITNKHCRN